MIEKARRLSRTGASISDEVVADWINEAMRQFVIDAGGITEVGEVTIIGNSVTVPEHFFSLHHLFIGRNELRRGSMQILANADIEGTPSLYFLSAGKILFDRKCSSPGIPCRIIYDRFPVELVAEIDSPELPEKAHLALVYLAASKLSEENFEYDEATRALANYRNEIQRYTLDEANANPSIFGK
ncbi:MAG: phage adaptor protein [Spirochaetales bacterium]